MAALVASIDEVEGQERRDPMASCVGRGNAAFRRR